MDFVGTLNFPNPKAFERASHAARVELEQSRLQRPTLIRDARATQGVQDPADATSVLTDGVGFMLVHAPSQVSNWNDTQEVAQNYYDEALALSKTLLPGATIGELASHTMRNEEHKEHFRVDGVQYGPCAEAVHNDHADFVSDDGMTTIKKYTEVQDLPTDQRVVGINIWRSISPQPLARFPLAVCDRTSVDPRDLEYELNPNAPRPFNLHYCKPNDEQRWNYFSDMTVDEALVFTTYDSHPQQGEVFRPTLHTAVRIPDSDGRQPRESIEVRLYAFFPLE